MNVYSAQRPNCFHQKKSNHMNLILYKFNNITQVKKNEKNLMLIVFFLLKIDYMPLLKFDIDQIY
jgi:hypothetical protein